MRAPVSKAKKLTFHYKKLVTLKINIGVPVSEAEKLTITLPTFDF